MNRSAISLSRSLVIRAVCLLAGVCVRWSASIAADRRQSVIEEIKRLHLAERRLLSQSIFPAVFSAL